MTKQDKTQTIPQDTSDLCVHLHGTLDRLADLLERETTALKSANEDEIAPLQEEKTALIKDYLGQFNQFKAAAPLISKQMPAEADKLRHKHERFQDTLESNLIALDAARTATHGILAAIFDIVREREGGPAVYGDQANMAAGSSNQSTAIAVDRAL